jgi:hypothetical protein
MVDHMDTAERIAGALISDEVLPPGAYWHKRLDKLSITHKSDHLPEG